MKKLTKLLCLILSLVIIAGMFAGCADNSADAEPSDSASPSESPATSDDASASTTFDYSAGLTEEGFFEGITAKDIVTLPEYKGLTIDASVTTATDEAVQAQIDSLLQKSATAGENVMDRAIADGDKVNIDYVGTVDGVEFDGGNTEGAGTDVTIGVTSYIDDFIDQLIGHTPGETFDVNVTFPDPYSNNPDLAGKDAVFSVTINFIYGADVIPEFTDELAANYGFGTTEELVADITSWVISSQKTTYWKELMAGATVSEMPQEILDYVKNSDLAYFQYYADSYGSDLETIIATYTGYASLDEYLAAQEEFYYNTAVFYLACQAMAEIEGLSVSDEEVAASNYASYESTYGHAYLKMYILQEVVCRDFVFDNAAA